MKKKEYMEPTVTVVQLQHRQQLLAGSYTDIRSKNSTDDDDDDYPDYDGNSSGSISIWDAN